jgi:thiamine-phosphate pyrophosphorylase
VPTPPGSGPARSRQAPGRYERTALPSTRLYAILDVEVVEARGLDPLAVVDAWLDAGVRWVQLRAKALSSGPLLELADTMAVRVREAHGTFIVNDRADVAVMCGAAGVHLGQDDLAIASARQIVGSAVVGLSTHTPQQGASAMVEPIDYMAVGPVFSTSTKAQIYPPVGLGAVGRVATAAARVGLPLVAIGGVTIERAAGTIEAGASAVAVISDLLIGDPASRAREYLRRLS